MQLSFHWLREHKREDIRFDMERENGSQPGEHAVVDWSNFFREVCINFYARHPIKIGGPGVEVEIDESIKFKRKYNRGRIVAAE